MTFAGCRMRRYHLGHYRAAHVGHLLGTLRSMKQHIMYVFRMVLLK